MLKRYICTLTKNIMADTTKLKSVLNLITLILAVIFLPIMISTIWIKGSIILNVTCLILNVLLTGVTLAHGLVKRKDREIAISEFILAGLWALNTIERTIIFG